MWGIQSFWRYRKCVYTLLEYKGSEQYVSDTVDTVNLTSSFHMSLCLSLYFSMCISPPLLGFMLTVEFFLCFPFSSPSVTCFCFFCVSLSLYLCASLSSDRSCWVFLLSHKVPSYGNPFIADTQTCTRTRTLLLFTCHPVWTETNAFTCQDSLLHLFPLSTLSCSPT